MNAIRVIVVVLLVTGVICPAEIVYAKGSHKILPYDKHFEELNRVIGRTTPDTISGVVLAGIAPHHAPTAYPLLSEFYGRIPHREHIKTVILLGPDHFNAAKSSIVTSTAVFETPLGQIESDAGFIGRLIKSRTVQNDERPFDREHSMGTHVPFIKKFIPNARIVPIVFRANTSEAQAKSLGKELAKIAGERVLVVASVDFTHYFTATKARPIDLRSKKLLEMMHPNIMSAVDADSPAALITLLTYIELKSVTHAKEFKTMNSADFTGISTNTTGYVTGYYVKENKGNRKK